MKGLYIYKHKLTDNYSNQIVGILKKVFMQYDLFKNEISSNFELVNIIPEKKHNKIINLFLQLFSKYYFNINKIINSKYDYIFIRRINPNNKSVIYMLKKIKENNPLAKIVYEIPTYPYDKEHIGLGNKKNLIIDKMYRNKLHKYVDRIVTLTDDEEIFGCKTLKITNGVNCNSIPVCKKTNFDKNNINIISVAQFHFWHGNERLIEGIAKYKQNNIILHLVGDGPEIEKYKALVSKYNLEQQVVFSGTLHGDELSAVFDIADVAVCSLACHKKNIKLSSELKSREYLCRGLPIITSTKIDIIPDNYKYCLRVPEDDSIINIDTIYDFLINIYEEKDKISVTKEIRNFSEENCTLKKNMKTVLDYFN